MNKDFFNAQNNKPQNNQQYQKPIEKRSGMSDHVWDLALTIIEVISDVTKATMFIGGVISANLADVVMGSITISYLFGGFNANVFGTPVWALGIIISMGASAIQIYLWSLLSKRNIGFKEIWNWKKLPSDIKTFLIMAFFIWFADTLIDVSPVALLVGNSQFQGIQWLNNILIFFVGAIIFVLCGFAELLTTNMRSMLMTNHSDIKNRNSSSNNSQSQLNKSTQNIDKNKQPNQLSRRQELQQTPQQYAQKPKDKNKQQQEPTYSQRSSQQNTFQAPSQTGKYLQMMKDKTNDSFPYEPFGDDISNWNK